MTVQAVAVDILCVWCGPLIQCLRSWTTTTVRSSRYWWQEISGRLRRPTSSHSWLRCLVQYMHCCIIRRQSGISDPLQEITEPWITPRNGPRVNFMALFTESVSSLDSLPVLTAIFQVGLG